MNRHCFHGFRENATNKFMENILSKEEKVNESHTETVIIDDRSQFDSVNLTNKINPFIRSQTRRETFISNKPIKFFSDGRTHSFSEIFERRPTLKFPSVKVSGESLKMCLESMAEEKKKQISKDKVKDLYDALRNSGEIEVPQMTYLHKVNKRVKEIVGKHAKKY